MKEPQFIMGHNPNGTEVLINLINVHTAFKAEGKFFVEVGEKGESLLITERQYSYIKNVWTIGVKEN